MALKLVASLLGNALNILDIMSDEEQKKLEEKMNYDSAKYT